MMILLLLKSRIKNFYEGHYRVVRGCMKALVSFFAIFLVTRRLNYNDILGTYPALIAVAALCGVTPDIITALAVGVVICVEIFHVSALLGGSMVAIFIIYFLLFGRLGHRQAFVIFAIPVLSMLHIDCTVPIVSALFMSLGLLPSILMGILLQYILQGITEYSVLEQTSTQSDITSSLHYLIDGLRSNKMMAVTMVAFLLTFLCVYLVRKRQIKNAPQIAIIVGAIVMMSVELLCNILMDLQIGTGLLALQVVISAAIAYIIQFFHLTLDYHGTKKLQFEDDEYYYYVTAVPKFKVTVVDRTVTRILSERKEGKE